MNPLIKKNLDGVLGNSLVEQRNHEPSMWDHTSIPGMLGEIPMWRNPRTGKMEPVDGYPEGPVHGGWGRHPMPPKPAPGWGHHPDWGERSPGWGHHYPRVETMEWNYERDGQNPLAGFGPIGPYNPDTDEAKVVPLDFLGGFMQDRNLAGSYGQPPNMPDYMYESIQRQYGNPKFGNYSIEDKKNVINWYNRMKV